MKLKSYTLLFRIFSFLSDKANGASFFVKYKLLLGTLIMVLASASACILKKEMICYVQIDDKPLTEQVTCYDSIVVKLNSDKVNIKGTVTDKSGEPMMGVFIRIKNKTIGTLTDIEGRFTLKASPEDYLIFSFVSFRPQIISVSELNNHYGGKGYKTK